MFPKTRATARTEAVSRIELVHLFAAGKAVDFHTFTVKVGSLYIRSM